MLTMLFLACTSDDTPTPDSTTLTNPTIGETAYYLGTQEGYLVDGSKTFEPSDLMFTRLIEPEYNTITETLYTINSTDQSHWGWDFKVNLKKNTFSTVWKQQRDNTVNIEGTYDEGAAWMWTAWHSTWTYTEGQQAGVVLTSETSIDDAGIITTHISKWDADGIELRRDTDTVSPSTKEEYDAAVEQIDW
jgi:hypothetical protein